MKKYLLFGMLFITVIITFISCEREQINEPTQQSRFKVETINQKSLEDNQYVISKLVDVGLFTKDNSRTVYDSSLGFTIQTDSIKYVENLVTGIHSYNFPLVRDSLITDNLENLILQSNEENTYNAFIVEYGFTNEQLSTVDETLLNSTNTKYTPIDFDTSIFTNDELNRYIGELVCVQVWSFETVPNNQGNLVGDTPLYIQEWILVSEDCTWVYGSSGGGTCKFPKITCMDGIDFFHVPVPQTGGCRHQNKTHCPMEISS